MLKNLATTIIIYLFTLMAFSFLFIGCAQQESCLVITSTGKDNPTAVEALFEGCETSTATQYELLEPVSGVPEAESFSDTVLTSSIQMPDILSATYRHGEKEETISQTTPQLLRLLNFILYSEEKGLTVWPEIDSTEMEYDIEMLRLAGWPELDICFSPSLQKSNGPFGEAERLLIIRDRCYLYRDASLPDSATIFFPYDRCYETYLEQSEQQFLDRYRLPKDPLAYQCMEPWIDLLKYVGIQSNSVDNRPLPALPETPIAENPGDAESCAIVVNNVIIPEKAYIGMYNGVEYYELPFLAILRGANVTPIRTASGYTFTINGKTYCLNITSDGTILYAEESKDVDLLEPPPGSKLNARIVIATNEEVYVDNETILLFITMQGIEHVLTSHDGVDISFMIQSAGGSLIDD